MTVYQPKHQRQSAVSGDPYWRDNCSAFCLAMFADAVTLGGLITNSQWVRANSNEPRPDPKSPGLNITQLDVVAAKLHIELNDMQGHTWTELVTAVESGRRVLAQIDYKTLAQYRCQANGDFGHMILIDNFGSSTGSLRANDPLCTTSKVYPSSIVMAAMTKFARDTGVTQGIRFAISRKVPQVA